MKSIKILNILFLFVLFNFLSCSTDDFVQKDTAEEESSLENALLNRNSRQLENPYTIPNMRKAHAKLMENKSPDDYDHKIITDSLQIEATDYYVKFWIENDEQLQLLQDEDHLMLSAIPLEIEVEESEDSPYLEDEIELERGGVWMYTSVVADYNFRSEITYEKIEDIFLPEPAILEGQEQEGETTKIGRLGEISKQFLEDLEDEALYLVGDWEEEDDEEDDPIIMERSKKRPTGELMVYNTSTQSWDAVPGIRVRIRRWFKWGVARTNVNGQYSSNRRFRRSPRYTFNFKHSTSTSNGLRIWSKWVNFSSAKHRAGKRNKRGYSLYLTNSQKAWRWATVSNAVLQYRDYCDQFGITKPHSNLRIIARNTGVFGGSSSAPMLRRVHGNPGFNSNNQVRDFLMNMQIALPVNLIADLLSFAKPDVIINTASNNTMNITRLVFHELGHASHFREVGNDYWVKYISYIITYGAYGDGTGVNAGHCEVGEMWGYFIDRRLLNEKFNVNLSSPTPDGWIYPIIFRRLENQAGYTPGQIFSCLKPNIDTVPKLKNELITTIGLNVNIVNNIFNDYGY